MFVEVYSTISIFLIVFNYISIIANNNYYILKLAEKTFDLKIQLNFKDIFNLYSFKEKISK